MPITKFPKLHDHSTELTDPRVRKATYPLINIVVNAVCAVNLDQDADSELFDAATHERARFLSERTAPGGKAARVERGGFTGKIWHSVLSQSLRPNAWELELLEEDKHLENLLAAIADAIGKERFSHRIG